MIKPDDIAGSIIKYILTQSEEARVLSKNNYLSLLDMRGFIAQAILLGTLELGNDVVRLILKEELLNHKIIEVQVTSDEEYNSYIVVVSNIEVGSNAYLTCFQYDDFDC